MKIIVCLDEDNGMMFNHRRQSKDTKVREDMIQLARPMQLVMNAYSYKMFSTDKSENKIILMNSLPIIDNANYQFIEDNDMSGYAEIITTIVVYYWNRKYPSDLKFGIDLSCKQWTVVSEKEFQGTSHEKITRRIYMKKTEKKNEI